MKQLFRFFALLLVAVVTSASAWAIDVPKPKAKPLTVGAEVYIMHVGTGMYVGQGESWSTQSIVKEIGLKYIVKNKKDDGSVIRTEEDGTKITQLPDGQYWLYSPDITGAAGHSIDRWNDGKTGEGVKCCFSDQVDWDERGIWQITEVATNTYKFTVPEGLTTMLEQQNQYVEGEALGVDNNHACNASYTGKTWGLYHDIVYADAPEMCQFQFVDAAAVAVYNAKVELAKKIDDAKELDIDVTAYEAIIANENATLEEVKAADAELQEKLQKANSWLYPTDITADYIVNPNPYEGSIDGWVVTDNQGKSVTSWDGGPSSEVFNVDGVNMRIGEFWNCSGYTLKQTIHVPAGVYTLRLYAMTRDGMTAVLKVGDNQTFIEQHTSSEANSRTGANTLFNAGKGINDVSWVQLEEGDVEISLTSDTSTGDHWLPWRNFQLLDRGYNMKSFQEAAKALAEGWQDEFMMEDEETGEMVPRNPFTQDYFDAVAATVESIPTSTDTESALAIYKKVQQSLNDLRENVDLYHWLWLHAWNETTKEDAWQPPYGGRDPYATVYDEASEIFEFAEQNGYNKTNEYLRDLKERFIQARQEVIWQIGEEAKPGDPVTVYIVNPAFKNEEGTAASFNGWTVNSSSTFQNNAGSVPVIEQWNGSSNTGVIDVSQEIAIRKVGAYRLKTKGWYRSTTNTNTHDTEGYNTVNTFLFGASSEYKFHDIYEHPYTPEEKQQYFPKGNLYGPTDDNAAKTYNGPAENQDDAAYIQELYDAGFSTVYPNNCTGANELFNNDAVDWYDMTCDFLGLGADYPVQIGVRGRNIPGYAWLIWDDFELIYIGSELKDMQPIAQQAADAAKEEFPSFDEIEANKAKWDALEACVNVLSDPQSVDELVEAYKKLDGARNDLRSSIEAYAKLRKENDKLNDEIVKYSETATAEALDAADALYTEVETMLAYGTIADEDIDAQIEKIIAAKRALHMPADWKKGSDKNPVDMTSMIENPKYFDETATMTAWEYEGIHNVEAENGEIGFAEGWGSSAESATFDIHQTITDLPAGTYKVKVSGLFRQGGVDAEKKMSQYEYAEKLGKLDMLSEADKKDVQEYNGAGQFYGNGVYKPLHRWNYIVTDEWNDQVSGQFIETGSWTEGAWIEYVDSVTEGSSDFATSYYLPDNRLALYQLVQLGYYDNELYCDVAEDGKLTIGACNQNATGLDWTPFSNWRLFYLGTESAHKGTGIDVTEKTGINRIDAIYSIDGRRLNALQKGMNIVVVNGKARKIMVK